MNGVNMAAVKGMGMTVVAGLLALSAVPLFLWMWLHHGDFTGGASAGLGVIAAAAFMKPLAQG
jgi:hypothetical protein